MTIFIEFARKYMQNKLAVVGLAIIAVATILAILGYLITPDSTPNCNAQHLEIAVQKPGFTVKVLKVAPNKQREKSVFLKTMLFGNYDEFDYLPFDSLIFEKNSITVIEYGNSKQTQKFSQTFTLANVLFAIKPETEIHQGDTVLFTDINGIHHCYLANELKNQISKTCITTRTYWLGTDRFGRDMLSRLIIGARISLAVGFIAVIISLIIGISLGALAGYYKGKTDALIMWFVNVNWSVPTLLMVIAITLVLGKGFWQVFIAVGLTMWTDVARVVRGQVLSIREKEYIEACRALGYADSRIIFKHILPNTLGPVIIIAASNFASAILMEAGLSFLGLGIQPPLPSWGNMIKDHYGFIIFDGAYLAFLPGIAIMLLVLAFTFAGNGLRDAFDVKS